MVLAAGYRTSPQFGQGLPSLDDLAKYGNGKLQIPWWRIARLGGMTIGMAFTSMAGDGSLMPFHVDAFLAGVLQAQGGDEESDANVQPDSPSLEDVYKTPPLDQYPTDWDGTTPPADGWQWKGSEKGGNWYNPETGDSISPPGDHYGHGEHIDWIKKGARRGAWWYPDGRIEVKP